jgi:hypothetical protein
MGEINCRCKLIMEIGFPSSIGGFVTARRARNPTIEITRITITMVIPRKMIGAKGMREMILFEDGDSYN